MASLLLRPTLLGLGASSLLFAPLLLRPQAYRLSYRADASPTPLTDTFRSFPSRNVQTPVVEGGRLNPQALKQVSAGSVLGAYITWREGCRRKGEGIREGINADVVVV
jgi:hypothetical protein